MNKKMLAKKEALDDLMIALDRMEAKKISPKKPEPKKEEPLVEEEDPSKSKEDAGDEKERLSKLVSMYKDIKGAKKD